MRDMAMPVIDLSSGRTGCHLLVSAGVHGDEYEGMVAIHRLAVELAPRIRSGRITLAPVVNVSAYRCGTRCGEDGKDLARICPGRPDGTATERYADSIAGLIRSCDAYIDLHSAGMVMRTLPICGYVLHRDANVLARQRALAKTFGADIIWGTTPTLDGRTLSIARDAKVPAIYTEYGGLGIADPAGIDYYASGVRRVAGSLGIIDAQPSAAPPKWLVEDDRDRSGYIQIQNPAPIAGVFVPAVKLGQVLRIGDHLGEVIDPLTGNRAAAQATEEGMVLMMRTKALVAVGEGLVAVLPISLHRG
jgi:predicted deacylase